MTSETAKDLTTINLALEAAALGVQLDRLLGQFRVRLESLLAEE